MVYISSPLRLHGTAGQKWRTKHGQNCGTVASSAYYQVDEGENKIAGPFCTNCFDNEYATRRLLMGAKPKGEEGDVTGNG